MSSSAAARLRSGFRSFLAAVQASIKAGKTIDQTVAEFKLPEKFAAYRMSGLKDNVTKIYAELQK